MAGLGTYATTAIITKGLTCVPVAICQRGLITTAFSLYCNDPEPPKRPTGGGGGGFYPRDAWNKFNPGDIQNFYKPVDMEQFYIVPRDQEAKYFRRFKIIKMAVKLGDYTFERDFSVPESKAHAVIKAAEVVNATFDNMKISASNIKHRLNDITMSVTKLRKK